MVGDSDVNRQLPLSSPIVGIIAGIHQLSIHQSLLSFADRPNYRWNPPTYPSINHSFHSLIVRIVVGIQHGKSKKKHSHSKKGRRYFIEYPQCEEEKKRGGYAAMAGSIVQKSGASSRKTPLLPPKERKWSHVERNIRYTQPK
jgi:hypothetical protein